MENVIVDSKIYVKPADGRLVLKILLNVIGGIYSIAILMVILIEGINIGLVGNVCLVWLIISIYNDKNKPRYQYSVLNLGISDKMINMIYENVKIGSRGENIRISIKREDILQLEYSEKLNAIRIVGNINYIREKEKKSGMLKEWVIYIDARNKEVLQLIEKRLNITICYMDRCDLREKV